MSQSHKSNTSGSHKATSFVKARTHNTQITAVKILLDWPKVKQNLFFQKFLFYSRHNFTFKTFSFYNETLKKSRLRKNLNFYGHD